jgi:hypothetical protein
MDERPFPHGPLPQPPPSRRGFLVVGGLAAVAAGGGVWWAVSDDGTKGAAPPAHLVRALHGAAAAELGLIGTLESALKHPGGSSAATLRAIRADHAQHLAAIHALIADVSYPATPSNSTESAYSNGGRVSLAELRTGEQQASRAAARLAGALTGQAAVLLASIAACEATHAELLR